MREVLFLELEMILVPEGVGGETGASKRMTVLVPLWNVSFRQLQRFGREPEHRFFRACVQGGCR